MKQIEVVAALIKKDNKILITKRNYGTFKDMWEFPGGKIEANEDHITALKREIYEELNVDIEINNYFMTIDYDYPDFHLTMHCYFASIIDGTLTLSVHDDVYWADGSNIKQFDWIPADIELINKLYEVL